ncbi:MAG: PadR family transcriptional regulator [Anaerolineales bacterium]|nr:PadR family transcriptional regulator [Anaerolineales bacterium]
MFNMMMNNTLSEQYLKLTQELRRGILVLAALSQLKEEKYGYSLISSLAEKGLDIDQGTLYPLLRRLESQNLLQSEWNVEGSRPRRYYVISPEGSRILEDLAGEWRNLTHVMENLLSGYANEGEQNESN